MKTCSTCKAPKPLTDYQPRSNGSTRLHTACKSCTAKYMAEYRAAHKEKIAAQKKSWVENNREHKAAQDKGYAQANPEARRASRNKWILLNPGKDAAAKALNKASRKKRIPKWLTSDDLWMISQAYEIAATRTETFGFSWHVDHKIPLNGRTVSGLHVPLNLQVIPWIDNLRKGNRV